jgi:hypothetical protein
MSRDRERGMDIDDDLDPEYLAHQEDRFREYARVTAKAASRETYLARRHAYHVASVAAAMIGSVLAPKEETIERVVDLLDTHWNEGVFTRSELEPFAEYGAADTITQTTILKDFDAQFSPEERNDLVNVFHDTPHVTIAERIDTAAEIAKSIEHYKAVMSRPVTADSTLPKLYDLLLADGRLKAGFTNPPQPRVYVIDALLPEGITALMTGYGGVNKTRLVLIMGVCITAGMPFFGMHTTPGAVIIVCGEDDRAEIDRRLGAIVQALALTPEQIQLVTERLLIFTTLGEDIRLTGTRNGSTTGTGLADRLIDRCREHAEQCGVPVRLVGFDHFALISGGDLNDNSDATLLNQQAGRIAKATGASVLTLAHHRKSSAKEDSSQHAVMGAAAIVNTARLVVQLNGMSTAEATKFGIRGEARRQYTRLSIEKANAVATGDVCWLHSVYLPAFDTIALERVSLIAAKPEAEAKLRAAKERIWSLVQEHAGRFSVTNFCQRYASQMGLGWVKVRAIVLDMVDEQVLLTRVPSDAERTVHQLKRQIKEVLVPGKALPVPDSLPPEGKTAADVFETATDNSEATI